LILHRILRPLVETRAEETSIVLLMFSYSFLAMTAYNMVQPITRSKFITAHGAENLPYVLLASIVLITLLMQGYSKLGRLMPGRWIIPVTQAVMVALLIGFWALYAEPDASKAAAPETSALQGWVATALYWFGQIYAILLISQFWTLANLIFDPRQAKRVFGFIGAGSSLGGLVGGMLPAFFAKALGSRHLLLVSAIVLAVCAGVVIAIVSRARGVDLRGLEGAGEEQGIGGQEALRMLRESKHLQIIAIVIGLTSIGAGLVDQQLNMATQAFKGRSQTDAMTAVLGQVRVYVSAIGFVIQMFLTTRVQRLLGVGFALMLLPVGFGVMAVIILLNAALWAPMLARVMDQSLRYTVDKTSREILFLPLPDAIKNKAKPFVDVTADRFARGVQGFLMLLLIAPWGLGLDWQQISYASLVVMGIWIAMVVVAKRAYSRAFRASLERHDVKPENLRLTVADLSTIEALVEELAHPDERRVLDAIDLLESMEKRNLVTPLLLNHSSPQVRARALRAVGSVRPEISRRYAPAVERLLGDPDGEVRGAAVAALASIKELDAAKLVRPLLSADDPRVAVSAAVVLAGTGSEAEAVEAEKAFTRLNRDRSGEAADARRDLAAAIRQFRGPRFRHLLTPLITDPDPAVAAEALRSVKAIGELDFLFVPALISQLRDRRHKAAAREVLAGYGEPVVDTLAHFLRDPDEDIWVRRHIPATLARIPCQKSMDALVAALSDDDGFLRFKAVAALERLRRAHPGLTVSREPVEQLALREGFQALTCLSLRYNLLTLARLPADALLPRALSQKVVRGVDRVFRLLGLIYPPNDITAARWALEHGDARVRANALEFLDNTLTGALRRRLMPLFDDASIEEKVRQVNVLLRTRLRDEEETLLRLINDDDEMVSALAIDHVRDRQLWTLEQDIEHVLAHRDPRDWFVFEAASWALAERRMPVDRVRQLWLEPLPASIVAGRLNRLPMFASVHVDELFRLARMGRQTRHEPGQLLARAGVVPDGLHVLLDGRAEATDHGQTRTIPAPATIGFEEFLENRPATDKVRAADVAVSLVIPDDELRTLLADNSDLVEGLFRTLVDRRADRSRVLTSGADADLGMVPDSGALAPLDKALLLHRLPVFSQVSTEEVLHLGSIAREIVADAGGVLSAGGGSPAICVLLSGELSLEPADRAIGEPIVARGGDVVGLYETLAGMPLDRRQEAVTRVRVLQIDRDDLVELMGERPALLHQLLGALIRNEGRRTVKDPP
jgi:ATP/ADP translocase/HEAT repeat protein/CRP-like cAMP-binding protein